MIFLDNQTDTDIELNFLEDITKYLNINRDIELLIVNNITMQAINLEQRGVDKTTDVLSFPLEGIEHMPLGSIVISIDKAKEVAKKLNHTISNELALLYTHGLLHLLGFDHEIDNGQMREKELDIIRHFNLPKSLIIRTQEEIIC
jgi:probable rRNA maturation factor